MKRLTELLAICLIAFLFVPGIADAKKKKKKEKAQRGELFFKISNEAGEMLEGVDVAVTAASNPEMKLQGKSDKDGTLMFEIEKPEGAYLVNFQGAGYADFETEISLNAGDRQEIVISLLDAAQGQLQDALRLYNAGVEAFNATDFALAREKFGTALELDPNLSQAQMGLANAATQTKDWAAAAEAAEAFLKSEPGDEGAMTIAYAAHRELGNTERMEELRGILGQTDLAPSLAIQAYNEGVVALQSGDTEGAITKFADAQTLNPEMKEVYPTLSTLYYNAQRYEESMAMVEKLLELDPANAQAQRVRFLVHDALGEAEQANAAIDAYFEADPKGAAEILYQRADLDFRDGNLDAAKQNLDRILKADPEMPRAHYTMGLIYMQSDTSKAREHLEKFIELSPEDPEVASAKEMLSYI